MVHIPCKDNAHEFVVITMNASNGFYSNGSTWKQCKFCGCVDVTSVPSYNAINVHDLSSVAKQRRKEGSL